MKNRKTLIMILLAAIILIGIFAVTRIAGGKKSADVEAPQEMMTQETTKNEENNLDVEAGNTPAPETQSQEPAPTEAPTEAPIEPPEDAEVLEVQEEVEIIVPEDQESEGF